MVLLKSNGFVQKEWFCFKGMVLLKRNDFLLQKALDLADLRGV